jgi:hypothetical protein
MLAGILPSAHPCEAEEGEPMDRHLALTLALALAACGPEKDTGPTDDTGTPDSVPETGETGVAPPPCGDGTWGAITDPELAVHVRADGSDDGDGSLAAPLATVEAALALTRARTEDKRIAVGPGTFPTNVTLASDLGDGTTDDGTAIQGCSSAETILEAAESSEPVVRVSGAAGVAVEGLCSRGGTRGIMVWSAASVTLSAVVVDGARGAGLVVNGNGTAATLTDVEVWGTEPFSGGGNGYGIAMQEGALVSMTGGGAWENTGVGILVSDVEEVSFDGIVVEGTQPDDDGYYGRGLQVQDFALSVSIVGSTFSGNHDAGIFALTALSLALEGSTVEGTLAGALPESEDDSGDGVVITRGEDNLKPSDYVATLDGNTVTGSDRAGIVLDGVFATVSGNALSDNGFSLDGTSIVSQGPADVHGDDTVAALSEESALSLNLEPMAAVDLTSEP